MVNKCVAFGYSSGYHTNREKRSTFSFPLGKFDLLEKWIKSVNSNDWFLTKNSVLCIKKIFWWKLFWEQSETKWIGIYIEFLQSIQKKIENHLFLPITTEFKNLQNNDELFINPMNYKILIIWKKKQLFLMVLNLKKKNGRLYSNL